MKDLLAIAADTGLFFYDSAVERAACGVGPSSRRSFGGGE
jgi:hypothetical protein